MFDLVNGKMLVHQIMESQEEGIWKIIRKLQVDIMIYFFREIERNHSYWKEQFYKCLKQKFLV